VEVLGECSDFIFLDSGYFGLELQRPEFHAPGETFKLDSAKSKYGEVWLLAGCSVPVILGLRGFPSKYYIKSVALVESVELRDGTCRRVMDGEAWRTAKKEGFPMDRHFLIQSQDYVSCWNP